MKAITIDLHNVLRNETTQDFLDFVIEDQLEWTKFLLNHLKELEKIENEINRVSRTNSSNS